MKLDMYLYKNFHLAVNVSLQPSETWKMKNATEFQQHPL